MVGFGRTDMTAIREVFEPCCNAGAITGYRGLTLRKCEGDGRVWLVTKNGEYVESINVGAIATASELQRLLDRLAEGREVDCGECSRARAGD